MTWADAFPAVVGVLYLVAGVLYWRQGQPALGCLSFSYSVASAALVWVGIAGR
jgi:hypothetical protein